MYARLQNAKIIIDLNVLLKLHTVFYQLCVTLPGKHTHARAVINYTNSENTIRYFKNFAIIRLENIINEDEN